MEMDRKLKEITDLTEEDVSDMHAKSVLIGFMAPVTKQPTAYPQGDTFEALKHAVVEFTSAVGTSTATDDVKSEPMQLRKVEGSFYDASTDGTTGEQENVWTMMGGKSCHTCGGKGHFARECPSKGKGKGQEGGWSKGGLREGTWAQAVPRVARIERVSPRAGRRVANVARVAARVQLVADGHV